MYKVLGFEFFNGKDGREWANLYVGFFDSNVRGMKCDRVFLSRDIVPVGIEVGDDIDIYKGLDNRIASIVINK